MSVEAESRYRVDRNTLRTNQAFIVGMTVLAFVLGDEVGRWIVLATSIVLAAGTLYAPLALFKHVHRRLLLPLRLLRADVHPEDPMPHQFAQAVGAVFLFAAAASLFAGSMPLGWALSWIVTVLAFINLTVQFCAGCFIYLQLDRVGLLPAAIASGRGAR